MILIVYLLAQALTPIDAERAFAAMASAKGQWTAFRAFATDDATMFVPQPAKAQEFLAGRKDPPKTIEWSPGASFISCDWKMAANTGPWKRPDGMVGYFSTIWIRQADGGWRWSVDGGGGLTTPRPTVEQPPLRRAACTGQPGSPPELAYRYAGLAEDRGVSPDGTLAYQWRVERNLARDLHVFLWNGVKWDEVIRDYIPPPPK